jgi:hypothetical protein
MNNTAITTLTIAAILAATLVVGVTLATTTTTTAITAFASSRGNGNGNTDTDQIAKQKAYVSGFDNSFNQELQNLICTHPSASCTVEQTPTPPPPLPPPPSDDEDGEDRHDDPKKMDDMSKYW